MSYDLGDHAAPDADEPDASTSAEAGSERVAASASSASSASSTGWRRARLWHVPRHRRAFHRFYREHFGLVWSMVRRFGVPSAQHEDAVQEVWLVAHRRLHTLEPEASAKAWLSSITRRVASRLRRTEHRQRRKLAALGVAADRPRAAALGAVEAQDARRLVDALLAELDDDQRDVLLLAQVHGLSGPEIAQVLEIPLNTAYSRLRLARRRIERFAVEAGSEEASVIRVLRRSEEPPPRAAAQVWVLLLPELGASVVGAGTAASTGLFGGLSSVKAFAVAVSVGVVGLVAARGIVDARAARASEPIAVVDVAEDAAGTHQTHASAEPAPSRASSRPSPAGSADETAVRNGEAPVLHPRTSDGPAAVRSSSETTSSPSAPATSSSAAASPATVTAEAELIARAQGSLRAGDAAAALRLLEEHERRFPAGKLGDERRGARVRALCGLGRGAQARAEAHRLLSERPNSPVAAGVADVCS